MLIGRTLIASTVVVWLTAATVPAPLSAQVVLSTSEVQVLRSSLTSVMDGKHSEFISAPAVLDRRLIKQNAAAGEWGAHDDIINHSTVLSQALSERLTDGMSRLRPCQPDKMGQCDLGGAHSVLFVSRPTFNGDATQAEVRVMVRGLNREPAGVAWLEGLVIILERNDSSQNGWRVTNIRTDWIT